MDAASRARRDEARFAGALQAPLLLIQWILGFGAGAYLGLSLEIEAILGLPQHPLVAASLPIAGLTTVAVGIWRLRWLRQALGPATVGAAFPAGMAGPLFLLGLGALTEL